MGFKIGYVMEKRYMLVKDLALNEEDERWVYVCYDFKTSNFYALKIDESESGEEEYSLIKRLNPSMLMNNFYIKRKQFHCIVLKLLGMSIYDLVDEFYMTPEWCKILEDKIFKEIQQFHKKTKFIHGDIKPENILTDIFDSEILLLKEQIRNCDEITLRDYPKSYSKPAIRSKEILKLYDELEHVKEFDIENLPSEFNVYLIDYGNCVPMNNPKAINPQTCYYISPSKNATPLRKSQHCGRYGKYYSTCDYWALGCLIYEVVTREPLFDPDSDDDNEIQRWLSHAYSEMQSQGITKYITNEMDKYKIDSNLKEYAIPTIKKYFEFDKEFSKSKNKQELQNVNIESYNRKKNIIPAKIENEDNNTYKIKKI